MKTSFFYLRPVFSLLPPIRSSKKNKRVNLELNTTEPIATVDKRYLSFSIDISVLAGGFWWEGSHTTRKGLGTLRVPPIDLNSKKLDQLVQALGPSYLRVGGSEADKIHYFETVEGDEDALVLTKEIWDQLHAFIQRNQLNFMFTFKYGLFKRSDHGTWQGSEIERLIQYNEEKGYRIDVCELGNELNAYWAFYGLSSQPMAKKLATDYSTFTTLIRAHCPGTKICGPGSAFWPGLGETIKPLSNITKKFLQSLSTEIDIVDWHYYPFQSNRSPIRTRTATLRAMLSPKSFENFARYSKQLCQWRDLYQPEAQIWTGETGSGQCGGEPKLSDRFASCFWWADQLGRGATLGQKVMVRQSLIGGDYALINRLTLKPKPDYWVSWLWVKLMGEKVFEVTSSNKFLRVYCHSAANKGNGEANNMGFTLLLVNMSKKTTTLNLANFGLPERRFEITAKKLTSKRVLINGIKPKINKNASDLSHFLSHVPTIAHDNTVKPYSINFWCYDHDPTR